MVAGQTCSSIFQFFFAYGCAHSQEKPKSQFSFRYRIPRYGESQEEVFFFVKNQGNGPQSHNPTTPHIFLCGSQNKGAKSGWRYPLINKWLYLF